MMPFKAKPQRGPEAIVQKRIMNRLTLEGWYVKRTHGNAFQSGFPDVFACHTSYGSRWIEVKLLKGSRIEPTQEETFTAFSRCNVGVWILVDSVDWEMNKLFKPANWHTYLDVMKTSNRATKIEIAKQSRNQPDGPERRIQEEIKRKLTAEGWYCKDTCGNIYQHGFADLYVCHPKWGARWLEVKNPRGYVFTPSQLKTFPLMQAHGCGVWVLTSADETDKLFKPANWWTYLDAFKS